MASVVDKFLSSQTAKPEALATVLRNMRVDAWLAANPPDGWAPGWSEDNSNATLPNGLTEFLADLSESADNLAQGLLNRIGDKLQGGIDDGSSVGDIADSVRGVLDDDALSDLWADSAVGWSMESAVQDQYNADGVSQWNWVLSEKACALCRSKADGGPYAIGAEQPPAHPGCDCGSEPA